MPREKRMYYCQHCGKEFDNYDDAVMCENSHEKDFETATVEEVIEELMVLCETAPDWHIGGEVLGIPVKTFCSLIERAIKLIEQNAK